MKAVGLFAGIGGFEVGFARCGIETVLLCENWAPASAVLKDRFAEVEQVEDVRTLRDLPSDADVVCAGFPCQDLSQAGMTAGIKGRKSSLVGQVFRLLEKRRIPWVVIENVSFMLQLNRGEALRMLVGELEHLGYRWAYRVVNSLSFLPQRRQRVFLVATNTEIDPADVLLKDDVEPLTPITSLDDHAHGFYWTEGIRGLGWAADSIPTLKNGSTIGIASPPAILLPDGHAVKPDVRDAERLQGFDSDWTRSAELVARPGFRWSLIGNSVSVPVSEWLGANIVSPGEYCRSRDRDLPQDGRWPRAARSDGSNRFGVEIGGFPVWREREHLHDFLLFEGTPLSARATRGFLERTNRGSLRFVVGFRERLRAHLSRMEAADHLVRSDQVGQQGEVVATQ